jgi:hypothetical protein
MFIMTPGSPTKPTISVRSETGSIAGPPAPAPAPAPAAPALEPAPAAPAAPAPSPRKENSLYTFFANKKEVIDMIGESVKEFQPNSKRNSLLEAEGIYEQLKNEPDVSALGFEKISTDMRKQLAALDTHVSAHVQNISEPRSKWDVACLSLSLCWS